MNFMNGAILLALCTTGTICSTNHVQVQRFNHVAPKAKVRVQVKDKVFVPTSTVSFFVGADLRRNVSLGLEERLARIEALLSQRGGQVQQQRQPPQRPQAAGGNANAVSVHCGKCHDKAEPDGGFLLSGQLTAENVTAAIRELASGAMPKGSTLTSEQKNAVMKGLLDMEASE